MFLTQSTKTKIMKATDKQKELAKSIADAISNIADSNDLQSSSHWNLNSEEADIISEKYSVDAEDLTLILDTALTVIRSAK
jgi:hypothetical protein